ncbi:Moenomycin biosynthesis protein MoeN5 [Streptomyces sp. NPDC050617]|uniref:Moenomycin biosynthesis protein MoeN5 n=1 Tax=Streptomyces sp. NPDC050617 TaxID=3154628 RepID=UPI00343429E1
MTAPAAARRPAPALLAEWDEAYAYIKEELTGLLTALDASAELTGYLLGLRGYLRSPYLLTVWTPGRAARRRLACDLTLHGLGMKLFDDLLDLDTDQDRYELGYCLMLWQTATRRLARRAPDALRVLEVLEDGFARVGPGQVRAKHRPARDLDRWWADADRYSGSFQGCYGRLAAVAGGVPEAADHAHAFAHGFGMVTMVADDLQDYRLKGERDGNLGHLLLTGAARPRDLTARLETARRRAAAAAARGGPAHDLAPVIDQYTRDVVERMLPQYAAG